MNDFQETKSYFNNVAPNWKQYSDEEKQKIKKLLKRVNIQSNQCVLDIGCGTGILFPFLEEVIGNEKNLFALDCAFEMVRIARNSTGRNLLCSDAHVFPFKKNSFDHVIAFHVFPHFHCKNTVIKECWKILKPSGQLSIIHLKGSDELNTFHASLDGHVKTHSMDSDKDIIRMMEDNHFTVKMAVDRDGEYFIQGEKVI